jgi:hypothetical protein
MRTAMKYVAGGAAVAALGYAAFAGTRWGGYGRATHAQRREEQFPMLYS